MQHVKKSWLSAFNYSLVLLDGALFGVYLLFEYLSVSQAVKDRWGITELILAIALIHAVYVLVGLPLLRKKLEWLASIISISIYAALFASIIDTSGNTNLAYRLGYAGLVFCMAMTGIYAPIATIVLTWLIMLFTYSSVVSGTQASVGFNFVINLIVTAAGVGGWLFFRRYYEKSKDAEAIALSKLLEQEQFKSNVMLESISDGVMVINTKGMVQVLNQSAATMLGWDKDEALRLNYKSLLNPVNQTPKAAADSHKEIIDTTLQTGKPNQAVSLLETHHGHRIYVDIVASPIFETIESSSDTQSQKQLVGIIAVLRNVDEQKRQEQQRSEFISTASHEMRTPVASIQGFLELALNPKVCTIDAKATDYLAKAHSATQHLGQLFQDLLTVSKSEDGHLENKPQVINIHDFLGELFEQEKMAAEQKGLKISFDADGELNGKVVPLMHVSADSERLREVLTNLIENAIKYTETGLITLGATLKDQSVVIRVTDTGVGIAEEDIPHLFQKFYRVDNSATREVGGTGLGLFIAKQLTESMHGRLWVESELGVGSTFFVELPRINPDAIEAQTSQPAAAEQS